MTETFPTIHGITSSTIPFYIADGVCHVLLGKRKDSSKAFPGFWCIVGGFLNPNVETLEQCAVRELQEETGIVATHDQVVSVVVQSDPKRDPRGHVIDNVYSLHLNEEASAKASDDLQDLQWIPIEDALSLNLAFDHEESLYLFGVLEGVL